MADDLPGTSPSVPPSGTSDAPAAAPDTSASGSPPPASEGDALARENQELRERLQTYDATLRALAQRPPEQQPNTGYTSQGYGSTPSYPPPQQPQGQPTEQDLIRAVAARTGQDEATVAAYFPMLRSTVEILAQPVVSTIMGLADRVNETRARMTVKDFADIEAETRKVVQAYRGQGVYLDWEQAAEIARTRLGPQLAARQAQAQAAAQTAQAGQAANIAPERSQGAPRPTPGTGGRPSLAEIQNMPRGAEKEALLTQLLGDSTF